MSQEIKIVTRLEMERPLTRFARNVEMTLDQAGVGHAAGTLDVDVAHSQIDLSALTTAGYAFFRNIHPTTLMQVGLASGALFTPFGTLKPGEFAMIRLASNNIWARAMHPSKLEFAVLED